MKKIFFACMVAAAMVSCSDDEAVMKQQTDASKISYSVVTETPTRATDIYCPNNMPTSFKVSAKSGTSTFFDGDVVNKSGNTWVDATNRYWPASGSLDFFAYVNDNNTFDWNTTAPTFTDFTVNPDVASQTDLLYAVSMNNTKPDANATDKNVNLNFRHALSQVVFRAKNTNPSIYVEVSGVSVVQVNSTATFTFPTENTDGNIAHGATSGTLSYNGWSTPTTPTTYSVDLDTPVAVTCIKGDTENTSDVVSITEYSTADDGSHGDEQNFGGAMLLIPQTGEKAVFTQGSNTLPTTGVYFKVKCKIWNVATPSATGEKATDDILLYPVIATGETGESTAAADILIPVDINWTPGMKYIYTFVFGNGNGGWDPDGPKPVFVPITFDVTVDEFIPVTNEDVTLDTNS